MLRLEADSVTSQSVKIPFDFPYRQTIPEGKDPGDCIIIRPITVGTWFRIKPLLASIDDIGELISAGTPDFSEKVFRAIEKNSDVIFEIVCLGIHNKKGDMPKWFRETLEHNATWQDIYILLNAILFRLSHNPFLSSITLLKSMSPIGEAEIIALRKNRETWNCTAASLS